MFVCSYTRFFLYKKNKCKKHRLELGSSDVNYRKSVDLDLIEMFLINKHAGRCNE